MKYEIVEQHHGVEVYDGHTLIATFWLTKDGDAYERAERFVEKEEPV